ncbi:hypothetical protein GGTG_02202 [Gaeumannomyces tritici R3-111a-1]|uniref:DNA damage-responsive protein 48 n=1 Tax=Gaeumannomyces tritici (strain R3-111a-1) TaxID=644352 RepID=J3NLQ2_GAET3|nr:hypothetical protein GGTG_02202 [Gaeumannomyces tritici R3-111a-1]EJT82228.1 hypothetical protein GGTG_02202 [Gaeumannomyces tritici R3-111a-1]
MDFIKSLSGDDSKEAQQKPHAEQSTKPVEQQGNGLMDKLSSLAGGQKESQPQKDESSGGFMDKVNSIAGGGKKSEKNEDALDKGVDWVQEHVLGQGPQNNEGAFEQAKDEQISDYIRKQYKNTTGSDFPVQDK